MPYWGEPYIGEMYLGIYICGNLYPCWVDEQLFLSFPRCTGWGMGAVTVLLPDLHPRYGVGQEAGREMPVLSIQALGIER